MPSNHISLTLKGKPLSESETLNSVQYIQGLVISKLSNGNIPNMFDATNTLEYQILFFLTLDALISNTIGKKKNATSDTKPDNSDKLEIKIQAEGRKRPFVTYIHATDELIALAFACAEEFKCDVDKVAIE